MPWYFYAIAGPLLWAIVNQTDKYLLERFYSKKKNDKHTETKTQASPGSLVLFSSTFGVVVAIVISFFKPEVFSLGSLDILLLLLAGFINIGWIICYLYALQKDEVSTIAPLFLLQIVFAYTLGILAFDEVLGIGEIVAILGVIIGAVLLSLDFRANKIKLKTRILFLMLVASMLEVISSIIFKYVAIDENFWISQFWQYAGLGIAGILIFIFVKRYRHDFLLKLRSSGVPVFSLNMGSEVITVLGNLSINMALLMAPVAIVYTFVSFQAIYVFILSFILTKLKISGLEEDVTKKAILLKIGAIIIMVIASSFLF